MKRSVVRDARSLFSVGLALALFAVVPATAQDEKPEWTFKWSNGFKLDSPDGDHKLAFGGRIMADYTFASGDGALAGVENGFEFRRARLFFSGVIYKRIEFKAEYDFAGGSSDFTDVYIGIKNDWGSVRFGHFREAFSLEDNTSSKYIAFLERSLPVLAFSPGRNSGVGVTGSSGDNFNWGFGAFYDADGFGDSTNEDNVNVSGRVGFRPIWEDGGRRMLHIGAAVNVRDRESSIRFRSRPEAHITDRFVNTGTFAADSATIFGGELAGVLGSFWFAGEYMSADVDSPASNDPSFDGYYVQAGYYLTGEHRRYKTSAGAFDRQKPNSIFGKDGGKGAWEIAARYSKVDLTDGVVEGGQQDNISVALNWYLNAATRLMINWVNADVDGSSPGEGDFLLVRWSVDF